MDLDASNRAMDRRLRRKLLSALHHARVGPRGGFNARQLKDALDATLPPAEQFHDDDHAVALLRDLEAKGLVVLADERTRRTQRFGLDYLFARITAKGSSLINETLPADADIDDERNLEGE